MSETFLIKKTTFDDAGNIADRDANSFVIGPGELNGPAGLARSSDLKLYGFGSLKWGEGVNQNLYRLLENNTCPAKELNDYNPSTGNNDYDPSSDPILPKDENDLGIGNGITTPIIGQHWFNNETDIMYTFGSTGWFTVFNDDGTLTVTGDVDMASFSIINLADAVNPNDAVNLSFADNRYVDITGDTMTGSLTMSAALNADANIIMGAGSTLDMGSNQINNLADPSISTDALTLGFADARFVNVTGDTITGVITMTNNIDMSTTNRVINLADPASDQHAATKKYVDEEITTAALGFIPVGSVMAFSGITVPTGWKFCDGSTVNRTVYTTLFATVGTLYGIGDGSTTFNLPDYRGEFLRGMDDSRGADPDAGSRTDSGDGTTGDNVGTKQADELESHSHGITAGGGSSGPRTNISVDTGLSDLPKTTTAVGGAETRPRNVNVKYIIYTAVIEA